jgi:maleylpyruvate isomerase
VKLHGYFRSTASYRVRIALNLKGLAYQQVSHHLRKGEQRDPGYLALNPQGLVPALELDSGEVLSQSLAICEYLDELVPEPPLLPREAVRRARVRAFAQVIACDIHPIQNLKILDRLRALGHSEDEANAWARRVIEDGFDGCAKLIENERGPYCFGSQVTLADVCLVPQLVNARRFKVDPRWPRLLEVEAACLRLDAFRAAVPEAQPDAE